jgi:hypothetical protein
VTQMSLAEFANSVHEGMKTDDSTALNSRKSGSITEGLYPSVAQVSLPAVCLWIPRGAGHGTPGCANSPARPSLRHITGGRNLMGGEHLIRVEHVATPHSMSR